MADGRVFWTEEQSRQNFVNVAKLVNPSDPDSSRLLNALAPAAGGERHSGGIFWDSRDHSEYRIIAEWIATGPTALELMSSRRWTMSFSLLRTADLREPDRKRDALR